MYAAIIFAPLLVIRIATTQDAPLQPRQSSRISDQITGYASAVVGVTRAEKNLPGYRRNPTNMAALRKWMAIQDSDKPELSRQTIDSQKKMSSQIETLGAPSLVRFYPWIIWPGGNTRSGLLEAK